MATTTGRGTVADPLVGRVLDDRYRLDGLLARGGMAAVYTATDTRLDRTVAVKIMRSALAEDPEFVERFAGEARAAARLSSPHVVAVFDQGTDATTGTAYLVMEYVAGTTLREVLLREGALPPARALALVEPVLRALAAAHSAGLVHRDVKPENVLLDDDGRVKVADFGLARAIETSSVTATTGLLIGTVAYLAPEQVESGRTDTRTDVYAAGILLWELLTGFPPYASDSPMSVAFRHVHEDVPPPSTVVTGISTSLDELVVRATRRDPAARPGDAGAFLAELRAVRGDPGAAGGDRVGGGRAGGTTSHPTLVVPRAPAPPTTATASVTSRKRRIGRSRETGSAPRRRGRIALLALLVLVAAALLGGGAYVGLTTPAPDVVGLTKVQAQTALRDAGFDVELLTSQFDDRVPAQHIVSQDPGAGSRLRRGGTVRLVNSKGPRLRAVPAVVGLTQDNAAALLFKAGLTLGTQPVYSDQPEGHVIASDPAPGAQLSPGSKVTLTVSRGLELLPVPDVTGQSQQDAQDAVANAGLTAAVTTAFSDAVDAGKVIDQTPASGTAPRGSTVALTVSKGPDVVTVPKLAGRSADDAVAALQALGLNAKKTVLLDFGPGQVLRTDPGGGKKVKRGSTVTVYIF